MLTSNGELRTKPYRIALLVGIVCIIPFGYGVRFSGTLNAPLLQDIVGSLAYQVLLMMVVAFLCPILSPMKCAVGIFFTSSAIEFLQLSASPFLVAVRATWLGRVVLGNTFLWEDLPPYAVGSVLGCAILQALRQRFTAQARSTL